MLFGSVLTTHFLFFFVGSFAQMSPWAWPIEWTQIGYLLCVILTVPLRASTSQVRDCTCLRYSFDSCLAWRRASLFRLAASERSANCQEGMRNVDHPGNSFLRVYLTWANEIASRWQINEGIIQTKSSILSSNLNVYQNMSKLLFWTIHFVHQIPPISDITWEWHTLMWGWEERGRGGGMEDIYNTVINKNIYI